MDPEPDCSYCEFWLFGSNHLLTDGLLFTVIWLSALHTRTYIHDGLRLRNWRRSAFLDQEPDR